MERPTYDQLLQMLDNVSAAAETMLIHYYHKMPVADREARAKLIDEARQVCSALLR